MLVFKILVILAILFCVADLLFTIHMLISSNKMINSVQSWAEEIDRSNNRYIHSEFARLIQENNLLKKEEKDEQGNDFVLTENEEEKQ